MKMFFMSLVSMLSLSAFAAEKCEIKLVTKDAKWFPTQYEANQYCAPYKLLGCNVSNPSVGRWNTDINFNEVFKAVNDDFKTARVEAYRKYFNSIEGRALYKMPLTFSLSFDCKPSY
jgi:hypothetical protein